MKKINKILSALLTFSTFALMAQPYNRCDDICRVLGYDYGECRFVTNSKQQCFCQEGDHDASWILPNACEEKESENKPHFFTLKNN